MSWTIFILILFIILILLYYLKQFIKGGVCKNKHDMTNKLIIITGSSSGLGKESAIDLLNHNAKIIFACRSEERTMKVINALPENLRKNAIFMNLDVSSFKSIINFVHKIKQNYNTIDILMNNAGSFPLDFVWTEDGYDSYFVSLYLGPFLLSALLVNHMNKDGDSKIINLSSALHLLPKIEKGDIKKYKNKDYMKSFYKTITDTSLYNNTKLFIIYMTQYFAKLCEKNNLPIKNVSLHPGLVKSDFFEKITRSNLLGSILRNILYFLSNLVCKTPFEGAQTQLHLSYAKNEELINGGYYTDCKISRTGKKAGDIEIRNEVINWTINELKKKFKDEEDIQSLEYFEKL